jgi:hypothetical protein
MLPSLERLTVGPRRCVTDVHYKSVSDLEEKQQSVIRDFLTNNWIVPGRFERNCKLLSNKKCSICLQPLYASSDPNSTFVDGDEDDEQDDEQGNEPGQRKVRQRQGEDTNPEDDPFKEIEVLVCGHVFHTQCIGPVLRMGNPCPDCRTMPSYERDVKPVSEYRVSDRLAMALRRLVTAQRAFDAASNTSNPTRIDRALQELQDAESRLRSEQARQGHVPLVEDRGEVVFDAGLFDNDGHPIRFENERENALAQQLREKLRTLDQIQRKNARAFERAIARGFDLDRDRSTATTVYAHFQRIQREYHMAIEAVEDTRAALQGVRQWAEEDASGNGPDASGPSYDPNSPSYSPGPVSPSYDPNSPSYSPGPVSPDSQASGDDAPNDEVDSDDDDDIIRRPQRSVPWSNEGRTSPDYTNDDDEQMFPNDSEEDEDANS